MIPTLNPTASLLNATTHPQRSAPLPKATATPNVIALYRQAETGGTTVAHEVGNRLCGVSRLVGKTHSVTAFGKFAIPSVNELPIATNDVRQH